MRIPQQHVLAQELREHLGLTTRSRLLDLGFSVGQINRLVRAGRLESTGWGTYRSPERALNLEVAAAQAATATGGAVCFPTAGELWNLRRTTRQRQIHVVVPWTVRRRRVPAGVRLHRTRFLPPEHIEERADGLVLTSALRTVFDAARLLSPRDLISMIDDGLYRRLFSTDDLVSLLDTTAHPCRDGSTTFVAAVAPMIDGWTAAGSDYEIRLEQALRDRGFPPFERQARLDIGNGVIIHPDLGLPADGFYIEVDHRRWHGSSADVAYDTWRDRQLRKLGLWVERVSDEAVDRQLRSTVDDLWTVWQRARIVSRDSRSAS